MSAKIKIHPNQKIQNPELIFCVGNISQLPNHNYNEIVFSGRSNVGKSTLINKILNRKSLARVSSKPGKTATINFYKVTNSIMFVDLPGYGYAKTALCEKIRWEKLVETYLNQSKNINLVVQLIDSQQGFTDNDYRMLDFLTFKKLPFSIVITKMDKLNKTQKKNCENYINATLKNYINNPADFRKLIFSDLSENKIDECKKIIFSHD